MNITVKHNFETAHRLPFLPGKCESLHGHSWWVEWIIAAPMDANGLTVEYGSVKKRLRTWVDDALDHGSMLGKDDPLIADPAIRNMLGKTFIFGEHYPLPWPTVEAVADMLANIAQDLVPEATIEMVKVQETHVNAAIWERE